MIKKLFNGHGASYNIRKLLFRATRGLVAHPMEIESSLYDKENDKKVNERTTPRIDEHIEVVSIWAAEIFTPSNIDGLKKSFDKLEWNSVDDFDMELKFIDWVNFSRESSRPVSINVGKVIRPKEKNVKFTTTPRLRAPLPGFAKSAHIKLFALSPSITCLTVCFTLNEEDSKLVEKLMRKYYSTKYYYKLGRLHIGSPENQKIEAIKNTRNIWRDEIEHWMKEYFPGTFSSEKKVVPICEVIISDNSIVLPSSSDEYKSSGNIGYLYGLNYPSIIFEDCNGSGVKFTWDFPNKNCNDNYSVLTIDKSSMIDKMNPGGRDVIWPEYYVHSINENYSAMVSRWSCLCLVSYYEKQSGRMRDATRSLISSGHPVKILEDLRRLSAMNADAEIICSDMIYLSGDKSLLSIGVPKLNLKYRGDRDDSRTFSDVVAHNIKERSMRIKTLHKSVNELITQQSALVSAHENTKLQITVKWLTVMPIIIGVVSSYGQLKLIAEYVLSCYQNLQGVESVLEKEN